MTIEEFYFITIRGHCGIKQIESAACEALKIVLNKAKFQTLFGVRSSESTSSDLNRAL